MLTEPRNETPEEGQPASYLNRVYLRIFLLIPVLIILYFAFQIFQPFFKPIALAGVLVSICYPAHSYLLTWLGGRRSLASFVTSFLVTAIIVIPFVLLSVALAGEVSQVYTLFRSRLEAGEFDPFLRVGEDSYTRPILDWVGRYVDLGRLDIAESLAGALQGASVFLLRHSTVILGGFAQVIGQFFIMLITMFFLFRDGGALMSEFSSLTPLTRRYEKVLVDKFKEVTQATVLGSLITALAQGVAGGLVFALLGVSNLIFWGALMALMSLVPMVGTALVWGPWALYFFLSGSPVKGILLVAAAMLFIGMIDNVLRPLLIEGKAGMHTMLVFFSIMGGIAYFGMSGMIFGPILVSLCLTFLELYRIEFEDELSKPS